MRRHFISHPFRLAAALVVAATFILVPGSPGSAAPTSVSIPVNGGAMSVNGTVITFLENPGAVLSGTYDPATGEFSGNLVIPGFGQTDETSLGDGFALTFPEISAPVTGTIPQTGSGSLGSVGWVVGVSLTGPTEFTSSPCSATIAPLTFTTTFDAEAGTLALTATGFTIPAVTCDEVGDEGVANAVLALPTTLTSLALSSSNASALIAPQEPTRPTFTG